MRTSFTSRRAQALHAMLLQRKDCGSHQGVVRQALDILQLRFVANDTSEGSREDAPVAVSTLEIGERASPDEREARVFRQGPASDAIDRLLFELR